MTPAPTLPAPLAAALALRLAALETFGEAAAAQNALDLLLRVLGTDEAESHVALIRAAYAAAYEQHLNAA